MKIHSKMRHMMAALLAAIVVVGGAIAPALAQDRYIPGPRGMTGPQGPKGNPGAGMLSGAGAPTNDVGANGDFYVDTANFRIYGPKAGGVWGPGSISLGIAAASPIAGINGGTGVSNSGRTITLGGNITTAGALTLAGAYTATFTLAGNTSVSFPVTGTLMTTTGDGSGITALNASNITSGALAVARGGTGATTATGSGAVVRNDSPVLITPLISGDQVTFGTADTSGVRLVKSGAAVQFVYGDGSGDGVRLTPGGGNATLSAVGSGTNIAMNYATKGNEWHLFKTGTGQILAAISNSGASTDRYPIISGGVSGSGGSAQIGTNTGPLLLNPNSPRIQLGCTTSSCPQIYQSGAEVQFLLADQTSAGGTTAGTRARYFRSPATALSNCGTPNGVGNGALCYASDLTSTNIGGVATGGGSLAAFVYSDGTNWRVFAANAAQALTLAGSSSGSTVVQPSATASGTLTLPATTGTLAVTNSPAFTGTPTTPTASPGTGGTQIASQAYVDAAVSSSGAVPTGTIMPYAGFTAPGGYFFANGQAVSRTTYAALFNTLTASATVTMTIASPAVVTWTAHGFIPGMPIVLTSTGALATGLTAGTTYYVVNVTTNTFELATTINGSSINTSGSQSGTHTARAFPFGVGDGSTTFNVPDFRGRAAFGVDNMGGVAAASRLGTNSSVGGITYNAILGTAGGAQTHVQTAAELAPHTHAVPGGMVGGSDVSGAGGPYLSAGFVNNGTSGSTGTASPMNITPPALVVNYIIRQRRRPANDNRRSTRPRQIFRRAA